MLDILTVVLPVFLVTGAGYLAAWRGLFADSAVDGLMVFTQKFAIPCLLFSGVATLDLGAEFDPALLLAFYTGSTLNFVLGLLGARLPLRQALARLRGHRLRPALSPTACFWAFRSPNGPMARMPWLPILRSSRSTQPIATSSASRPWKS
jgi:hypothetical protein